MQNNPDGDTRSLLITPLAWGPAFEYVIYQSLAVFSLWRVSLNDLAGTRIAMTVLLPVCFFLLRGVANHRKVRAFSKCGVAKHIPVMIILCMVPLLWFIPNADLLAAALLLDAGQMVAISYSFAAMSLSAGSVLIISSLAALVRTAAIALTVSVIYGKWTDSRHLVVSAAVVCGASSLVFLGVKPFLDLLWIRWRLGKDGVAMSVHYWKTSPGDFCSDSDIYAPVVVIQAVTSISKESRRLYGFSIAFSTKESAMFEGLDILNVAACELYERYVTLSAPAVGRNVNSNGVALHSSPLEARRRSAAELVERDNVLAHFYTSRPALQKFDLKRLGLESGGLTAAMGTLMNTFDSAWAFQLESVHQDIQVVWVLLVRRGIAASGWATGGIRDDRPVIKAMTEALSGYRFARLPENQNLLREVAKIGVCNIAHERFVELARTLRVTNTELQCAVLFTFDPDGERLKFLGECNEVPTVRELLTAITAKPWYPPLSITLETIRKHYPSPYTVVRAMCPDAFQIDWPRVGTDEIVSVAKRKGIELQLSSNAETPCIVY